MKWLVLIGSLMAAQSGCGERLVDGDYEGEPAFTFTGIADGPLASSTAARTGPLRLGLLWATDANRLDDIETYLIGRSQPLIWPSEYSMHVYERPTDARLLNGDFALVRLIAYGDTNENERFDLNQDTLYSARGYAATYAPVGLPANTDPTTISLNPGYTLVKAPLRCGQTPAEGQAICDVHLGEVCTADAQCADGQCIKEDLGPLGQGTCGALVTDGAAVCAPIDSRETVRFGVDLTAPVRVAWLEACQKDGDCTHEDYRCDLGAGTCGPVIETRVTTNEPVLGLSRLCR